MAGLAEEQGLTGAEKVSILLLALGEDVAPLVLQKMTEQEIHALATICHTCVRWIRRLSNRCSTSFSA